MAGEKFRRLDTPSLTGYVAPAGEVWPFTDYEYINKDPLGIDRAPMDDNPVGSPANNPGTFFVAFQDDASSSIANRPHWALAMNIDWLDNLLHRPISMFSQRTLTSGAGVATLVVSSGWVWTGDALDTDPADFVKILNRGGATDGWDVRWDDGGTMVSNKCVDIRAGGVSVLATGMVDATATPVTFVFESAIAAVDIWLYYATRDSVSTSSPGSLTRHTLNPSVMGTAAWSQLEIIRGDGLPLTTAPSSTIHSLEDVLGTRGMDESYRRLFVAGSSAVPDSYYYTARTAGLAGNGGWIRRDGTAPTVFSLRGGGDIALDPTNACHRVVLRDTAAGFQPGGSNGYVACGARALTDNEMAVTHAPGFSTFLSLQQHQPAAGTPLLYTRIPEETPATIAAGVITLTAGVGTARYWMLDPSLVARSAIACGVDLIEFKNNADGVVSTYRIMSLDPANADVCNVVSLSGTTPALVATGTVRFRSVVWGVGDGCTRTGTPDGEFSGLFYTTGNYNPHPDDDASTYEGAPAAFYGPNNTDVPVAVWGYHENAVGVGTPKNVPMGTLTSEGNVLAVQVRTSNGFTAVTGSFVSSSHSAANSFNGTTLLRVPSVNQNVLSGATLTIDASQRRFVQVTTIYVPVNDTIGLELINLRDGMEFVVAIKNGQAAITTVTVSAPGYVIPRGFPGALSAPGGGGTDYAYDLYRFTTVQGVLYFSREAYPF